MQSGLDLRPALAALDRAALADAVLRDVAPPSGTPDDDAHAAARDAVDWLLDSLAAGPLPDAAALERIGTAAATAARAGEPLQPILDRALSAGWVVWGAASARGMTAGELAALGDALLRTGDAAAAAIANAHESAERELARRSGAAFREVLDGLLELEDGDATGRGRLERRLGELGVPADRPVALLLVGARTELEDGSPIVVEVARRIARSPIASVGDLRALAGPGRTPVVATVGGRLLSIAPADRPIREPAAALEPLGPDWVAIVVERPGLLELGSAVREASGALAIALRLGRHGHVLAPDALALEQALLADASLLRRAVERELGPLATAPRGAGLVETLETYLGARENVAATARTLGIAPRTVAYRLERIERLIGGPLDADRRLRIAAALLGRRLLR